MVFKEQKDINGQYIDNKGVRFDVLSCERTESKKRRQIGTRTIEIDGNTEEISVYEDYVAINDGWDEFANLETAIAAYGLTYEPLEKDHI